MTGLNRIARYAGRPLLMTADAARVLAQRALSVDPRAMQRGAMWKRPMEALRRMGIAKPTPFWEEEFGEEAEASDRKPVAYAPSYAQPAEFQGYGWSLVQGIACLSIDGALLDRGAEFCGEMMWGYDTVALAVREAMADSRVRGVFIRMDSPGGIVAGGLEALTKDIRRLRATGNTNGKPIWTFADCAASAAYWIAAQSDRILAPAVGLVGSIGAVIVHQDWSEAYAKAGVKVTSIQFGAKKTDGADFKPLSEAALADLQAEIDAVGERFVADVVAGRPILTREALIATQAGVVMGSHPDPKLSGLSIGFVDEIAGEEDAFQALLDHVSGAIRATQPKSEPPPSSAPADGDAAKPGAITETPMKKSKAARIAALSTNAAFATLSADEQLAEIKKIIEENETPEEEAAEAKEEEAEGGGEPTAAEEEKTDDEEKVDAKEARAIMKLPEAKGRSELAAELALTPGMTAATAKKLLAAAPKASRLVGEVPDPQLGAAGDAAAAKVADQDSKAANFVRNAHAVATGKKPITT